MSKIFPKIHNEGYKFIIIFVIATIILYFINGFLGFIGLVLTIWCYYFFRDPERVSIGDDNYLTSPADGVVLQVMDTTGPKELGLENKQMKKIIDPIVNEGYDFVLGARTKNLRDKHSMTTHQIFGNWLACLLMKVFFEEFELKTKKKVKSINYELIRNA